MKNQQHFNSDSGFRTWLHELREVRGNRPLWPVLLGQALNEEFLRQRYADASYAGDVFKDRDDHHLTDGDREERLVARLYRSAMETDGCVHICQEPIWLLGFQWPTQGGVREKKRQADLVGITPEGGLVVFEAKRATGEPPLIAICEGLDYLACLLRPANFAKILKGFARWRLKPERVIPKRFEETAPNADARPSLVVLGPESYFNGRHARSIRGRDWPLLAGNPSGFLPSIDLQFAATDFKSTTLWVPQSGGDGS
jgi:hypothetical protein